MRPGLQKLAVVLPFLLLYWIDIAHHTMFFDEVNAWAISAASPNLSTLFHYVHFEGHPWLWYFLLWFPSRLTHDPVGMKWLVAAIGSASILIFGLLSPFRPTQRALILASYFFVWEYTVMCRMYGVMLLLGLMYAVLRSRAPGRVVGSCLLLGMMANTDMAGMLLSFALLMEFLYSSWKREFGIPRRRWLMGLSAYAALVAVSVASLWPSREISWQSSGKLGSDLWHPHRWLHSVGDVIAAAWWPISPLFPGHFWDTDVLQTKWLYLGVPFVLYAYWSTVRGRKALLLLMTLTTTLAIVFATLVYPGKVRHWGICFLALVIGLWLGHSEDKGARDAGRSWSSWTYALFATSALAGAFALAGSWLHPFSRARETAHWLQTHEPPTIALMGEPDVSFASVAEELERPVYFLECDCVDTFKLFARTREDYAEPELPQRLLRAVNTLHTKTLIFVFYKPIDSAVLSRLAEDHFRVKPLASFADADAGLENYWIYEIQAE